MLERALMLGPSCKTKLNKKCGRGQGSDVGGQYAWKECSAGAIWGCMM